MNTINARVILVVAAVLMSLGGCAAGVDGGPVRGGAVRVALTSTSERGIAYRLVSAALDVTGPDGTVRFGAPEGEDTLRVDLRAGRYTVALREGWRLERVRLDGTYGEVAAALTSPNPATVDIEEGMISELAFTFVVDEEVIPFGFGGLEVAIEVTDPGSDDPGAGGAVLVFHGGSRGEIGDDEIALTTPLVLERHVELDIVEADVPELDIGARRLFDDGAPLEEVVNYELLHRLEGASLLRVESEVDYEDDGHRIDYVITIAGHELGVSHFRLMNPPVGDPLTFETILDVLTHKARQTHLASIGAIPAHRWSKSLLHVLVDPSLVDTVRLAWDRVPVRGDTILLISAMGAPGPTP